MYMLDTNILSAIIREPTGNAASRLEAIGDGEVGISSIVLAEIAFGQSNNPVSTNSAKALRLTNAMEIFPFNNAAAFKYGDIRSALKKSGTPIGANDLFIAAHALALEATLVTDNEREFSRVPGLKIENWLR